MVLCLLYLPDDLFDLEQLVILFVDLSSLWWAHHPSAQADVCELCAVHDQDRAHDYE